MKMLFSLLGLLMLVTSLKVGCSLHFYIYAKSGQHQGQPAKIPSEERDYNFNFLFSHTKSVPVSRLKMKASIHELEVMSVEKHLNDTLIELKDSDTINENDAIEVHAIKRTSNRS